MSRSAKSCFVCEALWPASYRTCPVDGVRLGVRPADETEEEVRWPPTMSEHDLLGTFVPEGDRLDGPKQEYRWGVMLAALALLTAAGQALAWGVWALGEAYPRWWILAAAVIGGVAILWILGQRGVSFATALGQLLAAPFAPFVHLVYTSFRPRRELFAHLATVQLEGTGEQVLVEVRDADRWPEEYEDVRYVFVGAWTRQRYGPPTFTVRYAQPVDDDGFPCDRPIQARQDLPVILGLLLLLAVAAGSLISYLLLGAL